MIFTNSECEYIRCSRLKVQQYGRFRDLASKVTFQQGRSNQRHQTIMLETRIHVPCLFQRQSNKVQHQLHREIYFNYGRCITKASTRESFSNLASLRCQVLGLKHPNQKLWHETFQICRQEGGWEAALARAYQARRSGVDEEAQKPKE